MTGFNRCVCCSSDAVEVMTAEVGEDGNWIRGGFCSHHAAKVRKYGRVPATRTATRGEEVAAPTDKTMSDTNHRPSSDVEYEPTPARKAFLRLRDAVGLPPGGEIVHKPEVIQVAEALPMDRDPDWPKRRLIFEMVHRFCSSPTGELRDDYTWADANEPEAARDYSYLQSREARALATFLEDTETETEATPPVDDVRCGPASTRLESALDAANTEPVGPRDEAPHRVESALDAADAETTEREP